MSYLTQHQLDQAVDLPLSLPIADLFPEDWLIVSTIAITPPQTLTLRWLQAFILTADDPSVISSSSGAVITQPNASGECVFPPQQPSLVTPGLGLAFLGLYRNFNSLSSPSFQSPQESPLILGSITSIVPVTAIRITDPIILSADGAYSLVICNNTKNRLLRVVVSGQLRASLGLNP